MDKMEKLTRCYKKVEQELHDIGIDASHVRKLKINSRAKTRFGQCELIAEDPDAFDIEISSSLIELAPEWGIKTVIAHEIIHTLPNCFNHGTEFKKYADKINKAYPEYNIESRSNAEDLGFSTEDLPCKFKHKIVCTKCGLITYRQRSTNFTEHVEQYHCAHCSGKLRKEY